MRNKQFSVNDQKTDSLLSCIVFHPLNMGKHQNGTFQNNPRPQHPLSMDANDEETSNQRGRNPGYSPGFRFRLVSLYIFSFFLNYIKEKKIIGY